MGTGALSGSAPGRGLASFLVARPPLTLALNLDVVDHSKKRDELGRQELR